MKSLRIALAPALAAGCLFLLAGCGSGGSGSGSTAQGGASAGAPAPASSPAATVTAADRQEADHLFATRCATCHGANAEGDGPAAAGLNPKPRNFHDHEWQEATSNETIESAIVYGGAAVGKSPAMAPNPDLQSKPGIVAALREKVRSFDGK
jgi:mono/diheme cytochrome c family protein